MPKLVLPLRDLKCASAKPKEKDYTLFDGHGLFLLVKKNGTKSWRFKYTKPNGKTGLTAFGDFPALSIRDARQKRDEYQSLLAKSIDPIEHKREAKAASLASSTTFETVARSWHMAMSAKWSPDHSSRIIRRLEQNLFPTIGNRPIGEIETRELLSILLDIEDRGAKDIAGRMKQQLTSIFRFGIQRGLLRYNPAQELSGCLLPAKTTHRPALPLSRLPELLQKIHSYTGRPVTKIALLLTLHTFVRSSELRFARWNEIDFDSAEWSIPAAREEIEGVKYSARGMKMQTPHLVPLSKQTVNLLHSLRNLTGDFDLLFTGDQGHWKPISEGTLNKALQRMGYDTKVDVCGHGFRTMACSALNESGFFSRDAIERQMSHQERDGVRAAYIHKAEFIAERRRMMQWWSEYIDANMERYIAPYDFKISQPQQ